MPYSGTLMTRVFTSRSQLPVEDAAVSILQHEPGGRQRLINIQTSDRSGNTVPTIIDTRRPKQPIPRAGNSVFPLRYLGRVPRLPAFTHSKRSNFPWNRQYSRFAPDPLGGNRRPAGQQSGYLSTGPIKEGAVLCQLSSHRIFQPISPFI